MDEDTEVIAIFLDSGADADAADSVDFTATRCLLRDASGSVSVEPTSSAHVRHLSAEDSGVFRRGKPIVDPVTDEVIGYELEEDTRLRIAVG